MSETTVDELMTKAASPNYKLSKCPHGCGEMIPPVHGDPLEPDSPYCVECGHIDGRPCSDGCYYNEEREGLSEETESTAGAFAVILDSVRQRICGGR